MRHLSPRAAISPRRAARRHRYAAYMASRTWQRRRRAWLRHWRATHPSADPACVVCDRAWTLTDDLHHASYDHLGHERGVDLVPMCRPCHEALHHILDQSGHWRAMPRRIATARIIRTPEEYATTRLRRRAQRLITGVSPSCLMTGRRFRCPVRRRSTWAAALPSPCVIPPRMMRSAGERSAVRGRVRPADVGMDMQACTSPAAGA
jgi:hypothetical protein